MKTFKQLVSEKTPNPSRDITINPIFEEAAEEYASQQHYRPTKKEIEKILKKYIYQDGDIYVFYSKRSINKVADEILSLMPETSKLTDEEIEEWAKTKYPHMEENSYFMYEIITTAKAALNGEIKHKK